MCHIRRYLTALILPLILPFTNIPTAEAATCPHVEVVFARGTDQPPGIGDVGQQLVDALHRHTNNIGVYPVNYPASKDFNTSTLAGVADTGRHIQQTAAHCPATRIVLGGYSQGAAVAGFVTSATLPDGIDTGDLQPLNPTIASHVAAVVLFGTPNDNFLSMIGVPPLAIGPLYADKTLQLCNDGDPVCSAGTDWAAHTAYAATQADQGATFAAWRL